MPHEPTPGTPVLPVSMGQAQAYPLPMGPLPMPAPTPTVMEHATLNSLELHIPIPIPMPPTPVPIVVAYPLSQTIRPPDSDHPLPPFKFEALPVRDSALALDPVPAPTGMRVQNSGDETLVEEVDNLDRKDAASDDGFELLDISEEDLQMLKSHKTVDFNRALNVPVNMHRLRAMRAKGKLPAPLLKFKHSASRNKYWRGSLGSSSGSGKENREVHLTGILKTPSPTREMDMEGVPDPNAPTEMETVQGESWYLPSAAAHRGTRRRAFHDEPEHHAEQDYDRSWETARAREIRNDTDESPVPVIPNRTLLDEFPLPPSCIPSTVPSVHTQPDPYTIPLPPTPSPTPSTHSHSSSRPSGYMYGPPKPLARVPSCKSCGSNSPASSRSSSRTLTPGPPPLQGPGCYYAYDLLTPFPGALPYSGFGSARSGSPKSSGFVSAVPSTMLQHG